MSKFSHGDWVDIGVSRGFAGESGRYLIAGAEYGPPKEGVHCTKFATGTCLAWPRIELLDAQGQPARSWVFNVCECVMRPVSAGQIAMVGRSSMGFFGALVALAPSVDANMPLGETA